MSKVLGFICLKMINIFLVAGFKIICFHSFIPVRSACVCYGSAAWSLSQLSPHCEPCSTAIEGKHTSQWKLKCPEIMREIFNYVNILHLTHCLAETEQTLHHKFPPILWSNYQFKSWSWSEFVVQSKYT